MSGENLDGEQPRATPQPISADEEKKNLAASREMLISNYAQSGMSRQEAEAQADKLLAQPTAPKKD